MRIHGSRMLDAPPADVFAAICDPGILLGVIPGCQEIEQVGEAEYHGVIALRLPGIAGTYRTAVRLVETEPPRFGRLEGEVVGGLGAIRGSATFHLTDAAPGTRVDYEGVATIDGPLSRLDGRFVEGLAGSLIEQGIGNLNTRLQRQPATRETPA